MDHCVRLSLDVAQQMIEDGTAYGDVEIKGPEEFVSFMQDIIQRGVFDHLTIIAPRYASKLMTRYRRESRSEIGIR